ncbi:MAG: 3-phosphoserine/phosphohydroxythreonine transaminase [Bacteroides sp.]|nr:MAG: 3-phosphoserine/phosphohydroxythreonine transaminase [Bacteroides sp.]
MKKYNFGAGPSTISDEVYRKLSKSIIKLNDYDLSILEISHRSNIFDDILEKTIYLFRKLLNINNDYSVLFLSGGATKQFFMIPYNFLENIKKNECAGYIDSGFWSYKAINYAKYFGNIDVIASSRHDNYKFIPKKYKILFDKKKYKYLHFTSNNTIVGTQFKQIPKINNIPIISDMSSDILSKFINIRDFDMIYASSQKNIGPLGVTIVIIKKEFAKSISNNIPGIMNYKNHINSKSVMNTPNIFAIYGIMLNLEWLKNKGGIKIIEEENNLKAKLLYSEIDRNSMLEGTVNIEDRSFMNICFNIKNKDLKDKLVMLLNENNIVGFLGHKLHPYFRISLYNAINLHQVKFLIKILQLFEKKYS